jgi:hypothetical protein
VVKELTTNLPPPPAPHLSPTRVVVENPEGRTVVRWVKLAITVPVAYALVDWLRDPYPSSEPSLILVGAFLIGMLIYVWITFQAERVWAGSNWLSSNAGRTWVDLDNLEELDRRSGGKYRLIDASRNRAQIDSHDLRRCPVLFDLLIRALLKAERDGKLQGRSGSWSLLLHAPPGYRPPKI